MINHSKNFFGDFKEMKRITLDEIIKKVEELIPGAGYLVYLKFRHSSNYKGFVRSPGVLVAFKTYHICIPVIISSFLGYQYRYEISNFLITRGPQIYDVLKYIYELSSQEFTH